jgi:hypothetical protein
MTRGGRVRLRYVRLSILALLTPATQIWNLDPANVLGSFEVQRRYATMASVANFDH